MSAAESKPLLDNKAPKQRLCTPSRTAYIAASLCLLAVAVGMCLHPAPQRLRFTTSTVNETTQSEHTPVPATSLRSSTASSDDELAVPSASFCLKSAPPFVCAHGGDTSQHPPNTAAAYAAALDAGADCMEVDASLTSDLQLVALHDRDLQRLLGQPDAKVQDFSWGELQALSWPSGERLLTVGEAVAQVQQQQSVRLLIIDVKTSTPDTDKVCQLPNEGGLVGELDVLLTALRQLPHSNNTLVWGKCDVLLRALRQADIPVMVGFTVMRAPGTVYEDPTRVQEAHVAAVFHGVLDAPLMHQLRQAQGQTVIAWTVDESEDMHRALFGLGVDGLVTNSPGEARAIIQEAQLACGGGGASSPSAS